VAEPVRFVSRFGHPSPALWFRLLWRVFPSAPIRFQAAGLHAPPASCCPAGPLAEHAAAQAGPHICLKSRQTVALGQHLDDMVSNAWNRVILFTAR